MKTAQVHLRIPEDELSVVDQLAGGLLSRQATATIIFRKALAAIREANPPLELLTGFALNSEPIQPTKCKR